MKTLKQTLTDKPETFDVKPWRTIMAKAQADAKKSAFNTASKALAKKGVTKPKHIPTPQQIESLKIQAQETGTPIENLSHFTPCELKAGESAPGVRGAWPEVGIDNSPAGVVKSGFDSTTKPENPMTETTKTAQDIAAEAAQAKMAAKQAKLDAKAAKDALKAQEAATKKAEREAAAEAKAQAREAKQAAKAAELAEKSDGKRTYFGSMLTLADRVKAGAYVKGVNGQLRTDDAVAVALESCKPEAVVVLLLKFLGLTVNPYAHLNIGQQSMNLRNKARGAIRADEGAGAILVPGTDTEPPVRATIAHLTALRDEGGYATAEAEAAAKADAKAKAKAKKEQERADKKAAAEAAKQTKAPAVEQPTEVEETN